MNIIEKKISELHPYGNNPRRNDDAVEYVANSIKEFGFKVPLVIDKENIIVTGHTRWKAAKKLGMQTVPCIIADDLTDEQIKAFRLADNKVAEMAEWDYELLDIELDDIELDMTDFGFDEDEEEKEPIKVVEDETEDAYDNIEHRAKLGDIWQLGRHRLVCGSSTDENDVATLMNGNKAKILFTSPPYSDMREYEGGKDLSVENIAKFISTYRDYTDYQCVNLGIQRKNHEIYPYWDTYIDVAHNAGYKLMAWNVWDKTMAGSIGQQSAFFPIRHEWIFVFGTDFFEINNTREKKESSIHKTHLNPMRQKDGSMKYTTQGDTTKRYKQAESVLPLCSEMGDIRHLHPATFPVGLPSEYIQSMTDEGDNVIEPFCGSGTTLIACEQTSRNCFGMELDPKYCDVILNRWEQFTGEKAVRIND